MQLDKIEGVSALPALRAALDREPYLGNKMGIARALTGLGDPRGKETMRAVCLDTTVRDDWRVEAASDLVPETGEPCTLALARIAGTPSSFSVYYALQVLSRERPEQAIKFGKDPAVIAAFSKALRSAEVIVCQEATKCISLYRTSGAKTQLQAALKRETAPETRK